MKLQTNQQNAFTLVEIMIVVAIIGLLAAIAIPNFLQARTKSQQNSCINNLRQIDGAIQQWALENKKSATATINPDGSDVTSYMGRGVTLPECPSDPGADWATSYSISSVAIAPQCLIGNAFARAHTLP